MTEELSAHRQSVLQKMRKAEELRRMHEDLAAAGEPDFAGSRDEELAAQIVRECGSGERARDWEGDHVRADDLIVAELRQLGYNKTADAWDRVGKWYA